MYLDSVTTALLFVGDKEFPFPVTQLGLGSFGVGWAVGVPGFPPPPQPLDHVGLLWLAHELGLHLVQYGDNLPLHVLDAGQRKSLRDRATELGIRIEVGTRGIDAANLSHYIGLAREFGSPILRVVVDSANDQPMPEEVVQRVRNHLPELQAADVTLAIENHDRFKAAALGDIITALDDPHVGICLDTVNSFGALEGPDVVVETLGRYVVNLHVKEFVVQRASHNMGFVVTGAPAGQGMLDVKRLLGKLNAWQRPFNAIIETWLEPNSADMAVTVARELEMVRESVTYLRQHITE
jgi:sugar phosphate isomerase/epimerase